MRSLVVISVPLNDEATSDRAMKRRKRRAPHVSVAVVLILYGFIFIIGLVGSPIVSAASSTNEFLVRIHASGNRTLPYRLLLPLNYDAKKSYPLLLFLHGAAARGQDNAEPLNWGPLLLAEPWVREKFPFFLVVPQCPRTSAWTELSWGGAAQESAALRLARELVTDALPKEFNIDPKRRYLTGVSMGGHAVWAVMIRRPGEFAAAVPVCAGGNAKSVTKAAAKYPVWAFHSDDDHLVPVQQARDLVKAWRAQGGTAKYTEYTGLRHSSWKKAYADAEMFAWLLQQKLP
jgi:predicted peptidase